MRVPRQALRQRATIHDWVAEGSMGSHFDDPRTVKASVQNIDSLSVEWKDEEVTVQQMIVIRPEDGPVRAGSRVTINGVEYRVVKAFPIPDDHHPSHYELMLRSWGYEGGGASSS